MEDFKKVHSYSFSKLYSTILLASMQFYSLMYNVGHTSPIWAAVLNSKLHTQMNTVLSIAWNVQDKLFLNNRFQPEEIYNNKPLLQITHILSCSSQI